MGVLEVEGLTAGYGPVRVLEGISFRVGEGEDVVILGANGAGKTTTLRAVSGMIAAKGKATFNGTSILGRKPEELVRMGISHVPEGRGTLTELTVEENLRAGAFTRKDKVEIRADIASWYDLFPRLGERKDQHAGTLSGGEQQMLAVARAMMSRPELLLLDEPSLGLAPLVTQELFRRISVLKEETGMGILVVEQNANLALAHADRAYVLETGAIFASGTAAEIGADESVRKAYLGY